ncbi:hypothetical protein BDF20DRAFT_177884 [Mycotypha africana]|uniref:uncharacterized protein n=1 Tax=Mycotypha africana TaxID=64632 RepID=UPI002300939F|nr:uncharacterized protein BDF20DRAFT_177884 [Mycotypha africana]KAI8968376.1 hypothetical protein BDF20DRAFT_177884 [Mycotypha africana]
MISVIPTTSYLESVSSTLSIPSRTSCITIPTITDLEGQKHLRKRQERDEDDDDDSVLIKPTHSVVHVTVTAAGTVVYTQTYTSYSYVKSYIPASPSATSYSNDHSSSNGSSTSTQTHASKNSSNLGAIIGGTVGGVAAIALVGLLFYLVRRHKRKKNSQDNMLYDEDDSYYRGHQRNNAATGEELIDDDEKDDGCGSTIGVGSTVPPTPRHLVAPLQQSSLTAITGASISTQGNVIGGTNREENGRESKYYPSTTLDNGYYANALHPMPYYSATNSVVSDSMPSSTMENSQYNGTTGDLNPPPMSYTGYLQVPNAIDFHVNEIVPYQQNTDHTNTVRHVPHLKDDITTTIAEPPHSKD